jgi:hypothetical protein
MVLGYARWWSTFTTCNCIKADVEYGGIKNNGWLGRTNGKIIKIMLTIENRGRLISDSFYDKMGMYWVVDKIIDDTDEYLILIENRKGPKELFSLKKQNLYGIGYQLGLLDDNRNINKNMYKVKTYIPIETISDKRLLIKRMTEMIDTSYDI